MIDSRTSTRRIELTADETIDAIRQWLAKRDIVLPPETEIVLAQTGQSGLVDNAGFPGVILAKGAPVTVSMFWNAAKGG